MRAKAAAGSNKWIELAPLLYVTVVGVVFLCGISAFADYFGQNGPLIKYPPRFDTFHCARLVSAVGISLLICAILCRDPLQIRTSVSLETTRALWATASLVAALVFSFLTLLSFDPVLFAELGREDRAVEWASAALLFVGSGLAVAGYLSLRRVSEPGRWLVFAIAAVLFVVGMEEISWMQRIFDFATPNAFSGNLQHELNFHNFVSLQAEITYYFCSAIFLIVVPCSAGYFARVLPANMVRYLPAPIVAMAAAAQVGFNWEMVNIFPLQVAFFLSVALLVYKGHDLQRHGEPEWIVFGLMATLVIATQIFFLHAGSTLKRNHDATEYRELFIGLGFASYGLQLWLQSRVSRKPANV